MYVVNKKKKKKNFTIYKIYRKTRKKKKFNFIVFLNFLLFFCIVISVGLGVNYIVKNAPVFDKRNLYMSQSTIMLDKNGNEITRLGAEDRELVSYKDLPQVLVDAIVAAEDSRYFQHQGFDLVRFVKATINHLNGDSNAGGASTITMQISKQVFTSNVSTGIEGIIRKFTDIYQCFRLKKITLKRKY